MAQAEERDLAEIVGERVDVETMQGLELGMRGAARAHEIRVVGVREAVGAPARIAASTACSSSPRTRSTAPPATRTSAIASVPFA